MGAMSRPALPLTLVATLVFGCAPDAASPPADLTTTIDTINGVVHVTNTGMPPRWQLTQVASIGPKSLTEDGSPDEFGRIYDIALGPDQSVYVADEMNHEVRVFGVDGVHRFTFGRNGEGPGEFGRLFSVAWVGDRLLTLDALLGRISEFSADGEYLGQRRVRGAMGGPPGGVRFYPVGSDEAYRLTPAYRARRDTVPLMRCDPLRPPRPETKPFIEEIDIAYDGSLWVEVIRKGGNRWEVFDTEGRLMGSLPAPPRGHLPPAIGTDHVLTVRRGDLDLEYVDVWRIDRGGY